MGKVSDFFKGAFSEIRKVKWPTRKEAAKLTLAVVVFAIVFAIFTTVIDFGINKLFEQLFLKG